MHDDPVSLRRYVREGDHDAFAALGLAAAIASGALAAVPAAGLGAVAFGAT